MRVEQFLVQALTRAGGLQVLNQYWGKDRLTVLAHHRITNPHAADFVGFMSNVSATPEAFEQQLDWVSRNFNVISLMTLRAHVVDGQPLPERPLLITFDDGYMDNYTNAFPILKKYGFPAVIFIVTGSMSDPAPLWWDVCSEIFRRTTLTRADLPLIGQQVFETAKAKYEVGKQLIKALKHVPEHEKRAQVEALQSVLDVTLPDTPMFFGWQHVQELVANGIACQPHTVSHPILTRIPEAEMRRQLAESRQHILENSQQDVVAFAYPNGTTADYNAAAMQALKDCGYDMAFTLTAGPMPLKEIRQYPYQIKRVYLSHKDSLAAFQMKVMGLPALIEREGYL